jgi:hypothetical protein
MQGNGKQRAVKQEQNVGKHEYATQWNPAVLPQCDMSHQ